MYGVIVWGHFLVHNDLLRTITCIAYKYTLRPVFCYVSSWLGRHMSASLHVDVATGTFIALGLSGFIPASHYVITDGLYAAFNFAALGWLLLMAFLYIVGAVIYAVRIPERIWPGKFDIWVMPAASVFQPSAEWYCTHNDLTDHVYPLQEVTWMQCWSRGGAHVQFQSHQIFHVFVIAAAFVHLHGISEIATYRLTFGDCVEGE